MRGFFWDKETNTDCKLKVTKLQEPLQLAGGGDNWLITRVAKEVSSVAPLKSLYFHWTAICSSSIVFTPRSLFLLFVLLFSGPIVEDLTTAATPPKEVNPFTPKSA